MQKLSFYKHLNYELKDSEIHFPNVRLTFWLLRLETLQIGQTRNRQALELCARE